MPNFSQIPVDYLARLIFKGAGVALTFEKLRIANAQHGKNCVSSPAAKTTISTDLPKICHDRAGLQTAHRPFWLSHQQYVGTSIPSPGWDGEGRGRGNLSCLDPRQVLYKPLLGAKTKRLNAFWCVKSLFFAYSRRTAFSDLRSLHFLLR